MILLKACPRCGGDVDVSYHEDSFCVQCAYRPTVVYPGPRVLERRAATSGEEREAMGSAGGSGAGYGAAICPKCGSEKAVSLDRLRPDDNVCYRCRACGHIFSPGDAASSGPAVLKQHEP